MTLFHCIAVPGKDFSDLDIAGTSWIALGHKLNIGIQQPDVNVNGRARCAGTSKTVLDHNISEGESKIRS